jgi:two-component system cell cycle sensor histidine kinase/response regulator CckA
MHYNVYRISVGYVNPVMEHPMKAENPRREELIHELKRLREKVDNLNRTSAGHTNVQRQYDHSLEFYQNLLNSLKDPIFAKDESHRWVFLNDAACSFWGYRREDLIGKTDHDIFPKEEADIYWEKDNLVFQSGQTILNEEKQTINGKLHTIATMKSIYHDRKTGRHYVVGTIRDITEQKKAQEALTMEKDRAQRYLDIAGVMLVALDSDGIVNLINKKGSEILGYDVEDIIGKNWFDNFTPEEMRDRIREVFYDLVQAHGNPLSYFENPVLTKKGSRRMIAWHNTILTDEEGRIIGTLSSGEDVTDQKLLEEQLFQSQKMEAVGRLAGGIAHDFNNLLTAIIGYSEIIFKDSDLKQNHRSYIEEIKKSAERAATLTQQLLAFSRKQILQPKVLNLNVLLKNTRNMLQRMIGEDISFEMHLSPDIGMIMADPGKIEQVIINLAVNARDAMPHGGSLAVETKDSMLGEEFCKIHKGSKPGRYVLLSVKDTGKGIDEDAMKHIFEPFFTTKEIGKGTGLGLATVYGIVRQSGGYIDIQSNPGTGTAVDIYLPRVDGEEADHTQKQESIAAKGKHETILFVEDDNMVRDMVTAVLKQFGYRVVEAENATSALQACEEQSHIDLMITDVVMPGQSGPELAREVAKLHQEMKVLYISGYTNDAIVHHGVIDVDIPFLQKPFTPQTLALKVRELLEG